MDQNQRPIPHNSFALEERFEVIKEIGDGSFGSVALARVRGAGSAVAKRGTMIAIKTMKKTFDSFAGCLELREVIFLKTLPSHAHLVGALDIFLDPYSKKLHICMEYMDGNLYQLMKSRDHKCMDVRSVKSILYQILSGLEHIHAHHFFHRDIKPENILVTTSAPQDSQSAFSRYSAMVTPPSTPPTYSIKIADFGLARETQSRLPYTTYVSTRWYRAPEVLLRAGEYSAPVDIWAIGAMAVEIATLKPLFPGGNEVDQVWRVCEIMGSPGNWYTKTGQRVGGGEWREGTRLAQKLGFSFPKMAPHAIDTIIQPPQWPVAFSSFVTWCLMWDPKNRPSSIQALEHEFFADAIDPLRPTSKSQSRILGRKHSDLSFRSKEAAEPQLNSKPSWFRRSLIARESAPSVPQYHPAQAVQAETQPKRPAASKRATWQGTTQQAPMAILPPMRPVSPVSNVIHVHTQLPSIPQDQPLQMKSTTPRQSEEKSTKIGRHLSLNSAGNHYQDIHREEAERVLNANAGLISPPIQNETRGGFFSHLRKRARRFSGRHGLASPNGDDIEASAAAGPKSNRSSMMMDNVMSEQQSGFGSDVFNALGNIKYSDDDLNTHAVQQALPQQLPPQQTPARSVTNSAQSSPGTLKRSHSLARKSSQRSIDNLSSAQNTPAGPRARRTYQISNPIPQHEIPSEADELLHDQLISNNKAARRLHISAQTEPTIPSSHKENTHPLTYHTTSNGNMHTAYLTPSPSANRNLPFGNAQHMQTPSKPLSILQNRQQDLVPSAYPTPPHDEAEWAMKTMGNIFTTHAIPAVNYRL